MPLEHGKSQKAFVHNLKAEMEHGKPQKQALAIAYAIKRKAKKYAHGGKINHHDEPHSDRGHHVYEAKEIEESMFQHGHRMDEQSLEHMHDKKEHHIEKAKKLTKQSIKKERMRKKNFPKHFAEGGFIEDNYQPECFEDCEEPSHPHNQASGYVGHQANQVKHNHSAMMEDDKMFNQHGKSDEGAGDMNSVSPRVMKIIMGRAQGFSKGGQVANDTHQFEEDFEEPNEFDDLVLRDSDMEDADYTEKNSGDDLGNPGEDRRRKDRVMRAMMKSKKQHNPNPA